jgi:hypothetical protein
VHVRQTVEKRYVVHIGKVGRFVSRMRPAAVASPACDASSRSKTNVPRW